MDVLWWRSTALGWYARSLTVSKKLQTSLDVLIVWVKLCGTLVGIQRVARLVVAGLVLQESVGVW